MEAKASKVLKSVNIIVPILLIVAFLFLMLFLSEREEKKEFTPVVRLALEPFVMPNDELGDPKTEADLKGKITFISFWATYCGPCLAELPQLGAIYDRFLMDPDVQVWTISLDQPANENVRAKIKDIFDKKGVSLPVYLLSEVPKPESLMPRAIPAALLIDSEGRVVQKWEGAPPGFEKDVTEAITELLKAKEPEEP